MPGASVPYALEESLGHLATRFSKLVLRRIAEAFERDGYGVTSEQWSLLVHVLSEEGLTQRQLSERLLKDKTTVARLAGSLEAQGYIRRTPGEADAREKRLFLTGLGRESMRGMTDLVQGVLERAAAGVSRQDLDACKRVLRAACLHLKEPQT